MAEQTDNTLFTVWDAVHHWWMIPIVFVIGIVAHAWRTRNAPIDKSDRTFFASCWLLASMAYPITVLYLLFLVVLFGIKQGIDAIYTIFRPRNVDVADPISMEDIR